MSGIWTTFPLRYFQPDTQADIFTIYDLLFFEVVGFQLVGYSFGQHFALQFDPPPHFTCNIFWVAWLGGGGGGISSDHWCPFAVFMLPLASFELWNISKTPATSYTAVLINSFV
jgi:hypothetical protein